ncbi:MAG: Cu-processing system permease protein [Candidatus Latescibacterota bacterium]|jgi:Cu-processing system permease protein
MTHWVTTVYVAYKELIANLKSWWIVIMGLVCALLSWAVGSYGFSFASGQIGQDTVLVSLVHLQLYIVPLLGLLIAYDAVLAERESGMFDVHLALGVPWWSFLIGKWIGLFASLTVALVPSLALQAMAFVAVGGSAGEFIVLLSHSALLGSAVVSVGLLVSSASLNRSTVVSMCIGTWLLLAVLLDFLVVGILAATQGDVPDELVNALIIVNPLGSYRLLSYLHFFPEQVESLLYARGVGFAAASAMLAVWIVGPLLVTGYKLTRIYRPVALKRDRG